MEAPTKKRLTVLPTTHFCGSFGTCTTIGASVAVDLARGALRGRRLSPISSTGSWSAWRPLGGTASLLDVSKEVRRRHEDDLRASGDLFYTWQYDLRWAATKLRKQGRLAENGPREPWQLLG